MATKQTILDQAMRLIGASTFTDGDGEKGDLTTDAFYDDLLADMLRAHPWNFATKRAQLTASATAPGFEYEYAFVLPDDFVRVVSVHANSDATGRVVWKEELINDSTDQRMLLAESNELWLRYVALITEPNLMPEDFRRAFILSIARDCAIPLATSNAMQEKFEKMAERALARARSSDGLGSYPERRPRGSWVESRYRSLPVVGD